MGVKCVTCGVEILPERADLGFTYCTLRECVKANYKPQTWLEIGQTKSNATYERVTPEVLQALREGKFRRDPVVVSRQSASTQHDPLPQTFKPAKIRKYAINRVRFVQACHDQGLRVEEILERGAYMGLTREEVTRYMTGKRI